MTADRQLARFVRAHRDLLLDALDSHLYWQVNEDHTRRESGYVLEPLTAEEQAVQDAADQLRTLTREAIA